MRIDPAKLKIVIYPDPRLRKATKPVEKFDDELAELAARMLEIMHENSGVGLAGPQVGVSARIFVCNTTGEPKDDMVFVNPTLSELEGRLDSEEGCLSIPDVTVNVRRSATCKLTALDLKGRKVELVGEQLAARCWQHEFDHLEGKLILDRMNEADKIATRRALRQLEETYKKHAKAR